MTTQRKRPSKFDANFRLTSETTPQFLEEVLTHPAGKKSDYLESQVLSKFVSKETAPPIVRRNRAINKWLASEARNEATNVRMMTIDGEYNILPRVTYDNFFETVRRIIAEVIGDVPEWEALHGAFSGGATTSRRRTESHPASKYLGQADVTQGAYDLFSDVIEECELWTTLRCETDSNIRIVRGNELFTVLKSSEIDRCACKEPDFNMYLQKGLGKQIRRNLRSVGINLNDQTRNQRLARQGSKDGSLATLDLSSASDSVCTELVFQALPSVWYSTLAAVRSPETKIDGEWHINEMFSSMGNGFTFELESLLFYALSRAVAYHTGTKGVISVYGDDLIVPVDMAHDLVWVLSVVGFETNVSKSFIEGPFRESCGGHYHNGYDITPFYLKKPIERLTDLIHALNSYRKWCSEEGLSVLDPQGYEGWTRLAQKVPKELWGGHDYGDKTRLVSFERPNKPKRLSAVKRSSCNGAGGYLLWLDSKQFQSNGEAIATSEKVDESTIFRLRAVNWIGERPDPFPQELGNGNAESNGQRRPRTRLR